MKSVLILPMVFGLTACDVTQPNIPTVPLGDAVIAFAKEAKRAGAKQLTYTASVTVGNTSNASIAVPVSAATIGVGGSHSKEATSTVEIVVPIEETASKKSTGEHYLLNRRTNQLSPVAPYQQ